LRSYLGIPLVTSSGHAIGTLCVVDSEPRRWREDQIETLQSLAAATIATIEYRTGAAPGPPEAPTASQASMDLRKAIKRYIAALDAYDSFIVSGRPSTKAAFAANGRSKRCRSNRRPNDVTEAADGGPKAINASAAFRSRALSLANARKSDERRSCATRGKTSGLTSVDDNPRSC
jgi:hypothetical protein